MARNEEPIANEPTRPQQSIPKVGPHDVRPTSGPLDLNAAREEEIAEIDFIGKELAHAIVKHRASLGRFTRWEQLATIPKLDARRIAELQRAARINEP